MKDFIHVGELIQSGPHELAKSASYYSWPVIIIIIKLNLYKARLVIMVNLNHNMIDLLQKFSLAWSKQPRESQPKSTYFLWFLILHSHSASAPLIPNFHFCTIRKKKIMFNHCLLLDLPYFLMINQLEMMFFLC